jgi:hypothetical protein
MCSSGHWITMSRDEGSVNLLLLPDNDSPVTISIQSWPMAVLVIESIVMYFSTLFDQGVL